MGRDPRKALKSIPESLQIQNLATGLKAINNALVIENLELKKYIKKLNIKGSDKALLEAFAKVVEHQLKEIKTMKLKNKLTNALEMNHYVMNDEINSIRNKGSDTLKIPLLEPLSADDVVVYDRVVRVLEEKIAELKEYKDSLKAVIKAPHLISEKFDGFKHNAGFSIEQATNVNETEWTGFSDSEGEDLNL